MNDISSPSRVFLTPEELENLVLVTSAHEPILQERELMFAGLPSDFVQSLPLKTRPLLQLRSDLSRLNNIHTLVDCPEPPLLVWLRNAARLTHPLPVSIYFLELGQRSFLDSEAAYTASQVDSRRVVAQPKRVGELVLRLETLITERERLKGKVTDEEHSTRRSKTIDQIANQIRHLCDVKPGFVVAKTTLIRVLGSGNFGTIWLGKRRRDGKLVATKVFHLDKLTQGLMLWRFRRSIQAMRTLTHGKHRHPSIVKLFDVDESHLAFSMEYLSDGNLEEVSRRGWSTAHKVDLMITVCAAVASAHRAEIIHRDIKPANIVINSEGTAVLTDFDISDIAFVTRLSMVEGGLGTPVFAAPEQLRGNTEADTACDVYSLGRLLHYLLLEHSPGIQTESDPNLDDLRACGAPGPLITLVRHATQVDINKRIPSVELLLRALHQYESGRSRLAALWNELRRKARRSVLALSVALILSSAATAFAIYQKIAREEAEQARREAFTAREALEREQALRELLQKDLIDLQRQVESLDVEQDSLLDAISNKKHEADRLRSELRRPLSKRRRGEKEKRLLHLEEQIGKIRLKQNALEQERARTQARTKAILDALAEEKSLSQQLLSGSDEIFCAPSFSQEQRQLWGCKLSSPRK